MQTIYTFRQHRNGSLAFPHFECNLCGRTHYLMNPLNKYCDNPGCRELFVLKDPLIIRDVDARLDLHIREVA